MKIDFQKVFHAVREAIQDHFARQVNESQVVVSARDRYSVMVAKPMEYTYMGVSLHSDGVRICFIITESVPAYFFSAGCWLVGEEGLEVDDNESDTLPDFILDALERLGVPGVSGRSRG